MWDFDEDDNQMKFEEFVKLIKRTFNDKSLKESTKEVFELIENKEMKITKTLLRQYLLNMGEGLTPKVIEELFDGIQFDNET